MGKGKKWERVRNGKDKRNGKGKRKIRGVV